MDEMNGAKKQAASTIHTTTAKQSRRRRRRKMRHIIKFRFIFMILIVNEQHTIWWNNCQVCWNELLIIYKIYIYTMPYPVQWPKCFACSFIQRDWLPGWIRLPSSFTVFTFQTCVFVLWMCVCDDSSRNLPNAFEPLYYKKPLAPLCAPASWLLAAAAAAQKHKLYICLI